MEVGIDIEEISRIKRAVEKWGDRFLNRIYTKREIEYCFKKKSPYPSLTGRFCVKEAVIKVFGGALNFSDIETVNEKSGKPLVYIRGKTTNIKISISHTKSYAVAFAVMDE